MLNEELSDKETRAIFNTNVFGTLNVTRGVLPYMRAQQSGRIVMLGSIASFACDPGGSLYDGGKAVLASISEVLSLEMKPFGIESMVILPGMFRTNFFDGSSIKRPEHTLPVYDDSPARSAEDYCLGHNYQQHGEIHLIQKRVAHQIFLKPQIRRMKRRQALIKSLRRSLKRSSRA